MVHGSIAQHDGNLVVYGYPSITQAGTHGQYKRLLSSGNRQALRSVRRGVALRHAQRPVRSRLRPSTAACLSVSSLVLHGSSE